MELSNFEDEMIPEEKFLIKTVITIASDRYKKSLYIENILKISD